jgi:hypothetical protein
MPDTITFKSITGLQLIIKASINMPLGNLPATVHLNKAGNGASAPLF